MNCNSLLCSAVQCSTLCSLLYVVEAGEGSWLDWNHLVQTWSFLCWFEMEGYFWQVTPKFVVQHISYLGFQLCHTRAGPKCLCHKQASWKTPRMPDLNAIHPSLILACFFFIWLYLGHFNNFIHPPLLPQLLTNKGKKNHFRTACLF